MIVSQNERPVGYCVRRKFGRFECDFFLLMNLIRLVCYIVVTINFAVYKKCIQSNHAIQMNKNCLEKDYLKIRPIQIGD